MSEHAWVTMPMVTHSAQTSNEVNCESLLIWHINNSRHLWRKYALIFVRGHYLFREANSFPRAKLEENCELRGTDNVQGQISEHIFAPNGGYCLYYPSNLFRNARSFLNWGIFNNYYTSDSLWKIWLVESIQSIHNSLWTWHDKCNICCRYCIYDVKFNVCLVTKPLGVFSSKTKWPNASLLFLRMNYVKNV